MAAEFTLPYAHLNLRRNPFGEFSAQERAQVAVVDIEEPTRLLSAARSAVQFTGEKGYGKTTHLLCLQTRFPDAGYVHIPEGETRPIPIGNPIMIDEAQRLTRWQRFLLFRSDIPLVLGTHTDYETELQRAGRKVLTVPVARLTSEDRLHAAFNARIRYVRRSADGVPIVSRKTVSVLTLQHGVNIRAMLHDLYLQFEDLDEVREV